MHDITAQVARVVVESGKNDLDLEWDRLKEIVSEFFVPMVGTVAEDLIAPVVEAGRRTFTKGGTLP